MPSVQETRKIDIEPMALWRLMTDIPTYAEWQVMPEGKVVESKLIRDASVLTGSARRINLQGGRWFEDEFFEAAAPGFIAYRIVADSTGTYNRTYKVMELSIRMVGTSEGGTAVTLSVNYVKASWFGRWFDFGGQGKWRRAFKRSLSNLADFVARQPKTEVFTPTWRQQAEKPPAGPKPSPPPAPAEEAPAAVEEAQEVEEPAPPEPDTKAIDAEIEKLRAMQAQMQEMGLSTDEIDVRLVALELEKLRSMKAALVEAGLSTDEIDARIAELEQEGQ
jgi:hypothetical protein